MDSKTIYYTILLQLRYICGSYVKCMYEIHYKCVKYVDITDEILYD